MDNCPTELLLKIFSYACTDGGRTGCALSLVSRRIRMVVTPIRFQTVSLINVPRMRIFLRLLDAMPNPPHVSHLFLSHYESLEPEEINSGYTRRPHRDVCACIVSTLSASLISLMAHLLYVHIRSTDLLQFKDSFPLLQDLSIACAGGEMTTSGLPLLPNLRRFHIYLNSSDVEEVSSFVHASPQITHIRLSNIGQAAWFTKFLKDALQQESAALRLPVELKQLIVQPASCDPFIVRGGTRTMRTPNLLEGLRNLEAMHEVMVLIPEGWYGAEDAKEDWLDVVTGGDGCWRMPPWKTNPT